MSAVTARATTDALTMVGIRKSFGAVAAVRGVDFSVSPGEVHAIVGENGAGKSTLVAIAAGVLSADSGTIACAGRRIEVPSPRRMREAGIAVASQHPALAPDLTVIENLELANPRLTRTQALAALARLGAEVGTERLRLDPATKAGELGLAHQHLLEIVKALASDPRVLILDEPTEPFQEPEVRRLFEAVHALAARGVAIIYISHRLEEVRRIATRISVLRDGEMVATRAIGELSPAEVIELIAGRPIENVFPPKRRAGGGEAIVSVRGLSGRGFQSVSLDVRPGEIVGLTGVEGQGQREFLRALAGVAKIDGGEVRLNGRTVDVGTATASRAAGIRFVPDDRHAEGLFLPLSIRENVAQSIFGRLAPHGVLSPAREQRAADEVMAQMQVKAGSASTLVGNLSGGNQQKVLIGRELAAAPAAFIVDEPTKGVDVGAKSEIYRLLREQADRGVPIILSSSDGVELEGLCDRVVVFARGQPISELVGAEVTDSAITRANLSATALRKEELDERRVGLFGRLARRDVLPSLVLVVAILALAGFTNAINPDFLSAYNLLQMLTLLAILGLVSLGQLIVMMTGGVDLSVGPLAGFVVVLASFFVPDGASMAAVVGGAALILVIGTALGLAQGAAFEILRIPSIVGTLASFIGLQGVSLLLRPQPAGMISMDLLDIPQIALGVLPVAIVVVVALGVLLNLGLFSTTTGRALRAVGSNAAAAHRMGVDQRLVRVAAFGASAALTTLGGLILAGQIGIGSGSTGVNYTLMSITAVVLGGASAYGGRGSFVATLLAAALLQGMVNATTFLSASSAWQYWLAGLATLVAVVCYTQLKGAGAAARH